MPPRLPRRPHPRGMSLRPNEPAPTVPRGQGQTSVRANPSDGALRPVQSMTGFARATGAEGERRWTWELRSVNGRGLEPRFRLPPGYDSLEMRFRERLAARLNRGSIQATLTIVREGAASRLRVNEELLDQLVDLARRVETRSGLKPSLDSIFGMRGVIEMADEEDDGLPSPELAEALLAGLDQALESLVAARAREGEAIAAVILSRVDDVERLTRAAEGNAARHPDAIRKRLAEQVALLLEASSALDPQRLHQEVVLLATKADIAEELDRLGAHIVAARNLLAGGSPLGRQLDFLVQEFNREANTMCAKAGDLALTTIGLELKGVVDQLREQVQNLE